MLRVHRVKFAGPGFNSMSSERRKKARRSGMHYCVVFGYSKAKFAGVFFDVATGSPVLMRAAWGLLSCGNGSVCYIDRPIHLYLMRH